jgi:hypothetical protein
MAVSGQLYVTAPLAQLNNITGGPHSLPGCLGEERISFFCCKTKSGIGPELFTAY